jgi:LPXTG-motif cell wall-anchored protein
LFLDLSKVVSGNYTLRLNSIFNDKQKESNFNIEVIDKIDSPIDAKKESSSWFLVIGIMGLVIAILILVFIFVARRKEEEII